jgi:TPR repeat protein
MHLKGYSGADKNIARARELAAAGAALGCSDSKGVLGWLTYKTSDKPTGEQLMRESAGAGSAWGQWALGRFYLKTAMTKYYEVHKKPPYFPHESEFEEAARYFRLAADQGHSDAQARLGCMLEDRLTGSLFCSAEYGYDSDTDRLTGSLFCSAEYGYDSDAVRFYRMAAEQGHSGAVLRLKKWNR